MKAFDRTKMREEARDAQTSPRFASQDQAADTSVETDPAWRTTIAPSVDEAITRLRQVSDDIYSKVLERQKLES